MHLADYQQALWQALQAKEDLKLPFTMKRDRTIPSSVRLGVYRSSMLGGRLAALRQIFPCIEKLVGQEYSEQLGKQFIEQHPSVDVAINSMGKQFPAFLRGQGIIATVPYLYDMSCFEWAWHQVFHGPANIAVDYQKLAAAIAAKGEGIILQRALGAQLLQSEYPLHELWEMCQAEYRGDFVLTEKTAMTDLMLLQRGQRIHIELLNSDQWQLLCYLSFPQSLEDLCDKFAKQTLNSMSAELLPSLYAKGLLILR